jgi:hypothetical protein
VQCDSGCQVPTPCLSLLWKTRCRRFVMHLPCLIGSRACCARSSRPPSTRPADVVATPLAAFAKGIAADRDAVVAAITEPWSNGQTEGQITRLKLIELQMYGRASLDLLRARVCAPSPASLYLHQK